MDSRSGNRGGSSSPRRPLYLSRPCQAPVRSSLGLFSGFPFLPQSPCAMSAWSVPIQEPQGSPAFTPHLFSHTVP